MWTNTCCSHPLGIPGETGANLEAATLGVCYAAQRKLAHELGIPTSQVPTEKFNFLTRIHYKAPSDGLWGEHESISLLSSDHIGKVTDYSTVDYILFTQADVDLTINKNEVKDYKYVTNEQLRVMFEDKRVQFTPWFRLVCETMLFEWWSHLDNLDQYKNEQEIRRL